MPQQCFEYWVKFIFKLFLDLLTFYSNNGTTLYNGNLEKSVSGYQVMGQ